MRFRLLPVLHAIWNKSKATGLYYSSWLISKVCFPRLLSFVLSLIIVTSIKERPWYIRRLAYCKLCRIIIMNWAVWDWDLLELTTFLCTQRDIFCLMHGRDCCSSGFCSGPWIWKRMRVLIEDRLICYDSFNVDWLL